MAALPWRRQGFVVQQKIVLAGKLGLNQNIFEQEKKQAETEADEQKSRVVTNVKMSFHSIAGRAANARLRQNLGKLQTTWSEPRTS